MKNNIARQTACDNSGKLSISRMDEMKEVRQIKTLFIILFLFVAGIAILCAFLGLPVVKYFAGVKSFGLDMWECALIRFGFAILSILWTICIMCISFFIIVIVARLCRATHA